MLDRERSMLVRGRRNNPFPLLLYIPTPRRIAWGTAAVAHEGFGSCASDDTEPRQARKGAALR
jgi:hypothetical protein